MFCQKCGSQLSESAKFCANCGTPNEYSVQPAQSIQPTQQPVYSAPRPVENSTTSQPQQNLTDRLLNEYYKVADPQPGVQQPDDTQQELQPVRYTAEPIQTVTKKKRSKLVPGLCIAAGAVVALGGTGVLVYNMNKANINRMIMGDANYAYSVAMNAASGLGSAGQSVDAALLSAAKSGLNVSAAGNVVDIAADAANGDIYYNDSYNDIVNAEPGSAAMDSGLAEAAKAIEFSALYINELTGMSGAEVGMSGSLELSDSITEMISSSVGEEYSVEVGDIIDGLNTLKFTAAEKNSGSAYEFATTLFGGEDKILDIQMRYEQDGTFTMVFPGMTSTGLTAKLPEHSAELNTPDIPSYDPTELCKNLEKNIKSAFQKYEINCVPGETMVGGLQFSGLTVEIKLGKEDIAELIEIVADAIEDDEELEKYLEELDSSIDLDGMVESMRTGADSLKNSVDLEVLLTFYVNNNNTIAGGRLLLKSGAENSAECVFLSGGNDAEMNFCINDEEMLAVHIRGTSETAGRAELDMTGLIKNAMLRSEAAFANTAKYALYIDYTDVGVKEMFGMPTAFGTFTLSLSHDIAALMSGGDTEIEQTIEQSSITVSQLPQGKGVICRFGADISGYGKGELVITLDEPKGEVAPKPDGYTLIDIESASDEDGEKFGEDMLSYFRSLAEKNKLVGAIKTLVEASYSQVVPNDYDDFGEVDYQYFEF